MPKTAMALVATVLLGVGFYLQERGVPDEIANRLTGAQSGWCLCFSTYSSSMDGCTKGATGVWTCGPVIEDTLGYGNCSTSKTIPCGTPPGCTGTATQTAACT
jgi:hypothetical protein